MSKVRKEVTLDPENWDEMRGLGHQMLDDMMTRLQTIREHQFSWATEQELQNVLAPLTSEGEGEEKVYEVFRDNIMNHSVTHIKPLFWGAVAGTGSPYGMLTSLLTGGVNSGFEQKPTMMGYIHDQVIDWIKELLEYPVEAGGVLVGGGSEANYTGLAIARNAKAKVDMKTKGVYGQPEKMTIYCSDETHHCIYRSVELLGLGSEALRWLPSDDDCVIKIPSLKKAISDDKANGMHPFCVIGNAGTVNSGAFDDFKTLKSISEKNDMWLHVARALVKDKLAHYSTFVYGHEAEYLRSAVELSDEALGSPHMKSLQLSRNNTSLKAYMLLRAYGKDKYSRLIQQNIDQINHLADLVRNEPNMELMAPVISNIACFRYNPGGLDESQLEKLNQSIAQDIWNRINFWVFSDTKIKGKYMLRACNVNHRSRKEDFEFIVEEIKKTGAKLEQEVNT